MHDFCQRNIARAGRFTGLCLPFLLAACIADSGGVETSTVSSSQPGTVQMTQSAAPKDLGIQITPGSLLSDVEAALGRPSQVNVLKNDAPATMGAALYEYAFATPLVEVTDANGARHNIANLQLVTDPQGSVIRLAVNPNPFGPEATRTLRGSTIVVREARIPPGVAKHKLHQ